MLAMRAGDLWVTRFTRVGDTRFRPPLGGRCRSETGAPGARSRLGYAVSTACRWSMPVGDRRSTPFVRLGVRGFDRLSAVDAGRRPALHAVRAVGGARFRPPLGGRCRSGTGVPRRSCGWGCAVSTASRRSMPVGDRRSTPFALSWGTRLGRSMRSVSTASRRSMPVGDRRSASS